MHEGVIKANAHKESLQDHISRPKDQSGGQQVGNIPLVGTSTQGFISNERGYSRTEDCYHPHRLTVLDDSISSWLAGTTNGVETHQPYYQPTNETADYSL